MYIALIDNKKNQLGIMPHDKVLFLGAMVLHQVEEPTGGTRAGNG